MIITLLLLLSQILLIPLSACGETSFEGTPSLINENESTILTAGRTLEEIVIDGQNSENSWSDVKKLTITIQDGSIGQIDVELKALYDDNYVYLYISWPDSTKSTYKSHWTYNGDNNRWYQKEDEDRIAILWNVNNSIKAFDIGGCAMTCHGDRKSTNAVNEIGDMWQWEASRSNPVGYAEDNYLDHNVDISYLGGSALHRDEYTDGGYNENYNLSNSRPMFMQNPGIPPSAGPEFLLRGEKSAFNATYRDPVNEIKWSDGDTIPGYILEKPTGSRGDIEAKGSWNEGRWNVEFKRKLITGNNDDVEFDISKVYRFGIAVMDNTGGFRRYGEGHSFDLGARTLEFGGEGSEVITALSLIRDYLMVARGYFNDDKEALAKSEINNAFSIFESIKHEVADKDPQRYLDTKHSFEHARSHTTLNKINSLIDDIDNLILLFQGKIRPSSPSWEATFMASWTELETYVFIILSILALYLLFLIMRTIKKREWRRMSIFLLIITIPIFLEGTGRFGVIANISFFYNLSFMTNEYAKLLWGILMLCAIVFSTLGFRDLDNNINMLKRSEEEIKYLNAFNENVLRTVPIGIIVIGSNGKLTYVNPRFVQIQKLIKQNKKIYKMFNFKRIRKESFLYDNYKNAITKGKHFEILKYSIKLRDDKNIYLNIKGGPMKTIDGDLEGVLISFEDTTERIKLEEQLFHSEKLASIGQLAAGVAHELNTPLMNISLISENINTMVEDEKVIQNINLLSNQVYNAAKIVDDLLLFSRKKKSEAIPIDLNEIIENAISQLKKIPNNIGIIKHFDSTLPMIMCDSVLLERVFINMIQNAFDAMPDGGKLTIRTDKNNKNVEVEISDTGIGISELDVKKIFNPFYTTKGPQKGTGLGLSICHGIIQEYNGTIDVKSKIGQGTTFIIKLPR